MKLRSFSFHKAVGCNFVSWVSYDKLMYALSELVIIVLLVLPDSVDKRINFSNKSFGRLRLIFLVIILPVIVLLPVVFKPSANWHFRKCKPISYGSLLLDEN